MKSKRPTPSEIKKFNEEMEEFEKWKYGHSDDLYKKLPKVREYDFDKDAPQNPPWWYANLKKAWSSTQSRKAQKEAKGQQELLDDAGTAEDLLKDPDKWFQYCTEHEIRRSPGRPKLQVEQRKKPKLKHSDRMRDYLLEHGIVVDNDNVIKGYENWFFLANGRVRFKNEPSISAVDFVQHYG